MRTGAPRTMGSPGLHPNAEANSARFDSGPFTRGSPGEPAALAQLLVDYPGHVS